MRHNLYCIFTMSMDEMKLIEAEIAAKREKLKAIYKEIIEAYRMLCKVNDETRLKAVQARADRGREESLRIREEIVALQKRYFAVWDQYKKDSPGMPSQ